MDLTKSPEKIMVLSAAGVAALLLLLIWLFGPKPEKVQPVVQPPISLLALQKAPAQQEEEKVEEQIPQTWGRDPFALPQQKEESKPPPVGAPRLKAPSRDERPQYKLSTILITESSRLAVINDKVYAVGDKIGGEEISKITLDHIVLTDNSQERVLRVPQPQTEITVEGNEGK